MAMKLLKAGTARAGYRAAQKLCTDGCGERATARDIACRKDVCWFHLTIEHPWQIDRPKISKDDRSIYIYYGP